jgi:hypothetical protein
MSICRGAKHLYVKRTPCVQQLGSARIQEHLFAGIPTGRMNVHNGAPKAANGARASHAGYCLSEMKKVRAGGTANSAAQIRSIRTFREHNGHNRGKISASGVTRPRELIRGVRKPRVLRKRIQRALLRVMRLEPSGDGTICRVRDKSRY